MLKILIDKYSELAGNHEKLLTFIRFVIVGTCAAAIHYGIYFILQKIGINLNVSYTIGYLIAFCANFIATNKFTFGTKPNWKNFLGFAGSHGVNYVLHIVLFNFLLWFGVHKLIAPPLVMTIAMLVQYNILHFVFTSKKINGQNEK